GPPPEVVRGMDRGGPEEGRREGWLPPRTPWAPSEGSLDALANGARGGRGLDGASARHGHVRRNRAGSERDRGPGHRPSPVDLTLKRSLAYSGSTTPRSDFRTLP